MTQPIIQLTEHQQLELQETIKQWLYNSLSTKQKEKVTQYLTYKHAENSENKQNESIDAIFPVVYFVQGRARIPKGKNMTQLHHPRCSPEQLCNLGYF